jgi:hypothetical protein
MPNNNVIATLKNNSIATYIAMISPKALEKMVNKQ